MWHKFIGIGHLGNDVQLKFTPQGKEVATFSLAVNTGWGENKKTLWLRCNCWGKLATTVNQYLHKGSKCLVSGELSPPRIYEKDGEHRVSQDLTARDVRFLDSKTETSDEGYANEPEAGAEEIPF